MGLFNKIMDIKEKIKLLIESDIVNLYVLWGIEISGNFISKLIRLFIDKTNGRIDLLDQKASNQLWNFSVIETYLILNID